MFFIAALGEELGWSGYVIDPMQDRWGALQARHSLGVGVGRLAHRAVAAGSPIAGMDRLVVSRHGSDTGAHGLALQQHGQERFRRDLFHTMINLCWLLFPIYGSYFDPRLNGLIMALIAAIVTVVWGPRTLSRRGC